MFKLITQHIDDWQVVRLIGDLDQGGIDQFRAVIEKMIESPDDNYIFDFSKLKFICSEGLNILLWFRFQRSKKGSSRFVLSNASSFLEKIFNITKITPHFEIVPDYLEFLKKEKRAEEA
ncbi:STAS domain-containing protein [bacterium]|nr:STAS domain-containing protein [bacterium]